MDDAIRRPEWVVPSWWQVTDLSCLALRAVVEQQAVECAGMVAAVGWVRGLLPGPMTARTEDPLTRPVALAELWAATGAHPGWPTPPLAELCVMLRVPYREPCVVEPRYAHGIWLALRWLTGSGELEPPLTLPVRGPAGGPVMAEEAYGLLLADGGTPPAEDRAALWAQAVEVADRSHRLADLVADTTVRGR